MLTFSLLAALFLGWCCGGRLSRYEDAGLVFLSLPIISLVFQNILGLFPVHSGFPQRGMLLLISYGLLFFFLWKNRHLKKTAFFMGAGSLCNLAVIAANGWHMPVTIKAAQALSADGLLMLTTGQIPMYALESSETRLLFLGDILYCPIPFFRGFASAGDIFLACGAFFCLMAVMRPRRLPSWFSSG